MRFTRSRGASARKVLPVLAQVRREMEHMAKPNLLILVPLTYRRISCRPSLGRMFPWKQPFAVLAGHGNDLPLYSSSTRQIRNTQRIHDTELYKKLRDKPNQSVKIFQLIVMWIESDLDEACRTRTRYSCSSFSTVCTCRLRSSLSNIP